MQLAKNHLDIGLFTNNKVAMLKFWQDDIGLEFDHLGKLGGGVHQHRHFLGQGPTGPILKINHARDPLTDANVSGIQKLLIAKDGLQHVIEKTDPDGNKVALVPKGHMGISTIAVQMGVGDLADFHKFFGDALGFEKLAEKDGYQCGETLVFANKIPNSPTDIPYQAKGYRYLTAQIFDADAVHEHIITNGGIEGTPPKTLGTTVRYSFVRDRDGNWLELSERASLTGKAVTYS